MAVNEERTQALKDLEENLIRAEQWLSGSGLKVNTSKTELIIFHKHDSERGSIYLSQTQIKSRAEKKVLGIVFDSRLEWVFQGGEIDSGSTTGNTEVGSSEDVLHPQ